MTVSLAFNLGSTNLKWSDHEFTVTQSSSEIVSTAQATVHSGRANDLNPCNCKVRSIYSRENKEIKGIDYTEKSRRRGRVVYNFHI